MNAQELQTLIREKMDTFPAKTRRVVEYLLTNSSEVAFRSISEVANKLSVSKAQLVRVARTLGFDGYASLKDVLKRNLLEQISPSAIAEKVHDMGIPQNLCRLEHANLDETLNNLPPEAMVRFCEAAKKSATIYCMGWGISALVAEWFYTRFTELGLKTVLMRRGSMSLIEQSRVVEEGDMLVVSELPSYVIEVTEAVEKIGKKGAFVVTLTDSPAAPICRYSSLPVYVGDTSPTFGSSLIGPMFAVHVLTSVLAFHLGEEGQAALAAQKEGLNDERVYYPAYGLRY
ncbi:MAG: MurR/RpiR family transcriptional regulator [Synergistaceae bacterium]|jgi:DNA-binding MurR/RpiR family transcriptional regulator|nr:MurR/RpiR family transcriptional regulator [Synergistaceae bacterium]